MKLELDLGDVLEQLLHLFAVVLGTLVVVVSSFRPASNTLVKTLADATQRAPYGLIKEYLK